MCEATSQRKSYWEDLILSRRGERHSSGLERRVDELEGENQGLHEDLDLADERLAQERERATCSDETIISLERRVASLQDELVARQRELTAVREQPQDCGAPSFPQWGRGQEWLRAYDRHRAGVLVNNNERFNISISSTRALGPMQNFGPNSGMIDIAHALAYQGVPWGEVDNVCLYSRTLAQHLLTGNAPLSDTIHQALQGYKLHVSSADLAAWYGEDLPSGMAPAPALVGPALIKTFTTPSGTVVPPSEASNPSTGHSLLPVPGPQDQDQDMGGPTAPSETGATHLSSSDTTVVGHVTTEPMEVESLLSLLSSEPELAQEGAGCFVCNLSSSSVACLPLETTKLQKSTILLLGPQQILYRGGGKIQSPPGAPLGTATQGHHD
ncbi:hypothetical protein BDN67DRAFT_985434 [Paxillus ammoniavirescens]|nr:hypothetical protein BDN67DRAFT_985434 [Paxillus ammoniavirescens]